MGDDDDDEARRPGAEEKKHRLEEGPAMALRASSMVRWFPWCQGKGRGGGGVEMWLSRRPRVVNQRGSEEGDGGARSGRAMSVSLALDDSLIDPRLLALRHSLCLELCTPSRQKYHVQDLGGVRQTQGPRRQPGWKPAGPLQRAFL